MQPSSATSQSIEHNEVSLLVCVCMIFHLNIQWFNDPRFPYQSKKPGMGHSEILRFSLNISQTAPRGKLARLCQVLTMSRFVRAIKQLTAFPVENFSVERSEPKNARH